VIGGGPWRGAVLDRVEIDFYFHFLMLRVALGLCVAGALAGCGGTPPPVSALDASRANFQLADLQSGRTLLIRKCGGCHRVPMPSDETAPEWPAKLMAMSDRAKLDEQQRHLIEAYLVTMTRR
jgi:hypothetical protein